MLTFMVTRRVQLWWRRRRQQAAGRTCTAKVPLFIVDASLTAGHESVVKPTRETAVLDQTLANDRKSLANKPVREPPERQSRVARGQLMASTCAGRLASQCSDGTQIGMGIG